MYSECIQNMERLLDSGLHSFYINPVFNKLKFKADPEKDTKNRVLITQRNACPTSGVCLAISRISVATFFLTYSS
jgi:hypothetical protein